jgi:hypothetical protein
MIGGRGNKDAPPLTEAPRACGKKAKLTAPRAGVMWVVGAGHEEEAHAAEGASDTPRDGTGENKGRVGKECEAENEGQQADAASRSRQHPRGIAWVV